jgi:ParB family chromosome partitioning protein
MMKKALGRGLEALIPEDIGFQEKEVIDIKVGRIRPGRYQPRVDFKEEKQNELTASVKEKGLVQPIVVRPINGGYELIAGERRLRAAKDVGLESVPAIIKHANDEEALELSIIENVQREDLNPIEEAKAYMRLNTEFDLTQDDVAHKVGKSRAAVTNTIRLLKLPEDVQRDISEGRITMGHAKAILMLDKVNLQKKMRDRIIAKGMSVREAESYVEGLRTVPVHRRKRVINRSPDLQKIEECIQTALGTKVRIIPGKRKGKIEIEYYSQEDLERILTMVAPEMERL